MSYISTIIGLAQASISHSDVGLPAITPSILINNILNLTFIAIGAMAVLVIVLAGVGYITSDGKQDQVKKSKDAILYTIIGLVITTMAFTIVKVVIGFVVSK